MCELRKTCSEPTFTRGVSHSRGGLEASRGAS